MWILLPCTKSYIIQKGNSLIREKEGENCGRFLKLLDIDNKVLKGLCPIYFCYFVFNSNAGYPLAQCIMYTKYYVKYILRYWWILLIIEKRPSEVFHTKIASPNAWNFIKKRLRHQCFPANIAKFFRTTSYFEEHLRKTASDNILWAIIALYYNISNFVKIQQILICNLN